MLPNPAIFSYVAFMYLVSRTLIAKHIITSTFEYFSTKIINTAVPCEINLPNTFNTGYDRNK